MDELRSKNNITDIYGKVVSPAEVVNYQSGSVVSRTVIEQPNGSVTLFAFDEGQGLSEHIAPFNAMVYILNGEAEVTISGNSMNLLEGQMVIMPANKSHSIKANKRFKMMLFMVRY